MRVVLEMTDDEAQDVHHALGVTINLLEQITPGPDAVLTKDSLPGLELVARRLDHERHHGRVPNPNGPEV